jgi:hypothetical protein
MVTVTQGTPSSSYWSIVVAEKQRLLAWSEDKKKKGHAGCVSGIE